jgi:uncharacterized Fe-S cluster protein YjdI
MFLSTSEVMPMTGRLQVYETAEIQVSFDPARCIHSAECVRALPEVFDPRERRWVRPENAAADAVAAAVARCPTGALHAVRRAAPVGAPDAAAGTDAAVVIRLADHGPLLVRGPVRILDSAGELVAEDTRVALCRCGRSGNAPFCDGSHARAGFNPAR